MQRQTPSDPTAPACLSARPPVRPPARLCTRRTALGSAATCALRIALASGVALPIAAAAETYDVDPATGYRMERYRAPVPQSVPGGATIDTKAARALHDAGDATFVDVYPPRGLGPDPLDGHWVISEEHDTIPGSTWLPEVGRGHVEPGHLAYLERNLARLSGGDTSHPFVLFCTADCWQAWNATRRAAMLGYDGLHWYPLGTDGWREVGLTLERAEPVPFFDDGDGDPARALAGEAPDGMPGDTPAQGSDMGSDMGSDVGSDEASDAPAATTTFPPQASIALIDGAGDEHPIGTVRFGPPVAVDGEIGQTVAVELDGDPFEDHFLSMRPFRCIEHPSEWFCHLPYPYELDAVVSANDLTDLEYQLLFIRKRAAEFGIDAWNGVYYALETGDDGTLHGRLLEGDLNVLAEPPEPGSRPVDLSEFIDDAAAERRFPALIIRP